MPPPGAAQWLFLPTGLQPLFRFEPILFGRPAGAAALLPKRIGEARNILLWAVLDFGFRLPFRFALHGTGDDDCGGGSAHGISLLLEEGDVPEDDRGRAISKLLLGALKVVSHCSA